VRFSLKVLEKLYLITCKPESTHSFSLEA
jgi:hypothetical protein